LGLLPFFHIMATMLFHSCVYKGRALVVLPRFEPEIFLQVVEKYKLEKLIIAPPVALFLAQHPMVAKYDLSHVKQMGCGGAPLGIEVERMAEKRMNATVLQGFGMTELAGATTYSTSEAKRIGSAGKLLPNALLKVKSLTTGAELPPNEVGELLFHTPQLMRGYFNNPEATKAAFDEDGYLRTGDIGYIDDDGFVFIVDRIKELIKYKGHQVAPAELEDVLNNHPSVADACCVRGLDVKTGEEIPKAYVVLKQGAPKVTAEDIIAFVQTKVAPYKFVRELEFIETIPKSLSGKILRRVLQVKENDKIAAARKIQVQSRL
jgi:acyl-CoA synthetase (AMP-forming)/AMP-acid ligase II